MCNRPLSALSLWLVLSLETPYQRVLVSVNFRQNSYSAHLSVMPEIPPERFSSLYHQLADAMQSAMLADSLVNV